MFAIDRLDYAREWFVRVCFARLNPEGSGFDYLIFRYAVDELGEEEVSGSLIGSGPKYASDAIEYGSLLALLF